MQIKVSFFPEEWREKSTYIKYPKMFRHKKDAPSGSADYCVLAFNATTGLYLDGPSKGALSSSFVEFANDKEWEPLSHGAFADITFIQE